MRAVDTSAWIEGLIRGQFGSVIAREFPSQAECVVPTIVQLELAKWLARNASDDEAAEIIAYTTQCIVVDLDTSIAIRAAEIGRLHELAMADAIIYATALHMDADLLTCDAHFDGLDQVRYIPKSPT